MTFPGSTGSLARTVCGAPLLVIRKFSGSEIEVVVIRRCGSCGSSASGDKGCPVASS
jgi:hypothetical protein